MIDEIDDGFALPRKWLDKKQYVRVDPHTGKPQLIRIEPIVTEDGEFIPERVMFYVDDDVDVMDRDDAENLVESMNCSPLEITAHWKHQTIN